MDGEIPSGFTQSIYLGMDGDADSESNTDEVEEDNSPLPERNFLRQLGSTYRNYRFESLHFDGFRKNEASMVLNDMIRRYRKQHLISQMELLDLLDDTDFEQDNYLK